MTPKRAVELRRTGLRRAHTPGGLGSLTGETVERLQHGLVLANPQRAF